VAAFGAAARKNRTPVFGFHARQESVRLCPLAVIWLKCTFWHFSLLGAGKRTDSRYPTVQ
jgi:hypothetical protein